MAASDSQIERRGDDGGRGKREEGRGKREEGIA